MEHSLLAAELWDLRSSLERQLRCLTTIQQAHAEFRRSTDLSEQRTIKVNIVRDLNDINTLTEAVRTTLADALHQVQIELLTSP